jgi:hypothetical protein
MYALMRRKITASLLLPKITPPEYEKDSYSTKTRHPELHSSVCNALDVIRKVFEPDGTEPYYSL